MTKNNETCKNCKSPTSKDVKICQVCGAKINKPFYKKWWFWLIIIILIYIGFGDNDSNDSDKASDIPVTTESSNSEETDLSDNVSENISNVIEPSTEVNNEQVSNKETDASDVQERITDTISSLTEAAEEAYQRILDEYTVKLQEEAPRLAEEYKSEAAHNTGGLEGLAELVNDKIEELAVISNEGVGEMADVMYKKGGGSYDEYESWAGKLIDVYMDESQKIMDAYLDSAM